jgi:hypothetical protein
MYKSMKQFEESLQKIKLDYGLKQPFLTIHNKTLKVHSTIAWTGSDENHRGHACLMPANGKKGPWRK